jgi:translation initiation factor IF-2
MENKKLKLTISGKPKKSFKNFETTKSQGKHSVVIEKSQNNFSKKGSSFRPNKTRFSTKVQVNSNDFEKRKLAEQRATKRLKDDANTKDKKLKSGTKKRDVKLTVSRALSDEIEARERSLASVKRA